VNLEKSICIPFYEQREASPAIRIYGSALRIRIPMAPRHPPREEESLPLLDPDVDGDGDWVERGGVLAGLCAFGSEVLMNSPVFSL
jgi:hypothetical protein